VRYVPGVIGAVIDFLPDQLFEEYATRRDPAMVAIGAEPIAVTERSVMHDDAAESTARARREMCGTAALEVDHRRHGPPPLDANATRMCRSGNRQDTKTSREFKREFVGRVRSVRPSEQAMVERIG
jgi:hypothetical protein